MERRRNTRFGKFLSVPLQLVLPEPTKEKPPKSDVLFLTEVQHHEKSFKAETGQNGSKCCLWAAFPANQFQFKLSQVLSLHNNVLKGITHFWLTENRCIFHIIMYMRKLPAFDWKWVYFSCNTDCCLKYLLSPINTMSRCLRSKGNTCYPRALTQ